MLLTRAAPTVITEGLSLEDSYAFRVSLSAESGQTLSGAGTLRAYIWDTDDAAWIRSPDLDLVIGATHAGVRRVVWPDQEVMVPSGRMLYACDGVTASGGTTATVTLKAWIGGGR
jgi:hypothetical protein